MMRDKGVREAQCEVVHSSRLCSQAFIEWVVRLAEQNHDLSYVYVFRGSDIIFAYYVVRSMKHRLL